MKKVFLILILMLCTNFAFGLTIAEKLLQVHNAKEAIKTAIEARYIDMTGVPLSDFPAQIERIQYPAFSGTKLINGVTLTENIQSTDAVYVTGGTGKYMLSKLPTPSNAIPAGALAYGYANAAGTTGQVIGMSALWACPLFPTKTLTIGNPTVTTTKTFDGNTTAAVTPGTLSGLVPGHTNVTVSAVANYNDVNAGTGKTITVVYTLSGTDAYKYAKPANYTTTGTINQKQLTITAPTVTTTKTFDGNTTASVTPGTLSGAVSGYAVGVTAAANHSVATAGSTTITTVYTMTGSYTGNYIKPVNNTVAGVINKKTLSIGTPTIATTKTFDGSTGTTITLGTVSGLVSGYTSVTTTGVADFSSATAGTGKTITAVYSISGTHAGNYNKPANYTTSGIINAKQLTIASTAINTTKTFDGNTTATVTSVGTLGGLVSGYTTVTPACTATFSSATAGTGKTITAVYSISGTHAANYIKPVDSTYSTNGTINQKQLIFDENIIISSDKAYDGNSTANVTSSGNISGVISGYDNVEPLCIAYYDSSMYGFNKSIYYTLSLIGSNSSNYYISDTSTHLYTTIGVIYRTVEYRETNPEILDYTISEVIITSDYSPGSTHRSITPVAHTIKVVYTYSTNYRMDINPYEHPGVSISAVKWYNNQVEFMSQSSSTYAYGKWYVSGTHSANYDNVYALIVYQY